MGEAKRRGTFEQRKLTRLSGVKQDLFTAIYAAQKSPTTKRPPKDIKSKADKFERAKWKRT